MEFTRSAESGRVFAGSVKFTKKWCKIWDLTAPRKQDLPKLGTGCGTAIKKNKSGMRDFHKNGAGMRECGILLILFQNIKFLSNLINAYNVLLHYL